jgi:hypothetical protein
MAYQGRGRAVASVFNACVPCAIMPFLFAPSHVNIPQSRSHRRTNNFERSLQPRVQ